MHTRKYPITSRRLQLPVLRRRLASAIPRLPALGPWRNILRVVLLYGAGMLAVLWPRNVIHRMETFRPTLRLGAALTALTLWCVLSFTGVTTFIYSNF